jgi:hypothetical protein
LLVDFLITISKAISRRILYLEQQRAHLGARVGLLQGKIDSSVPLADYFNTQGNVIAVALTDL